MAVPSFVFGGDTGVSYEDLQRRRKAHEQRASQAYSPTTVGGGLSALGHAFRTRMDGKALNKQEQARQGQADKAFSAFREILSQRQQPQAQDVTQPPVMQQPAPQPQTEPAEQNAMPDATQPSQADLIRDGIAQTAKSMGIDPVDLATAISYETAGTFDPTKAGPTTQWGQHKGLIQFGEPQAKKYGVNWDDPIGSQLGENGAIAEYLKDAGVRAGMGLEDIYSAINAGGVGLYNRTDENNGGAPGTVRDKVENMRKSGHLDKAKQLFEGFQVASADPQQSYDLMQGQQPPQPSQPTVQGQQDIVTPELIQAMTNSSLSPQQRSAMEMLLTQRLQNSDPMKQFELQKAQLEVQQMQNPERKIIKAGDGFQYYQDTGERVLPNVVKQQDPTTTMQEYEYARGRGYKGSFEDWKATYATSGVTVNNNAEKGESKFQEKIGGFQAETLNGLYEAGLSANADMAAIQQLETLVDQVGGGGLPVLKKAGDLMGVDLTGMLNEQQAFDAIIAKLVPSQRMPGSGQMSDRDVLLFKESLPQLRNRPEGNKLIMSTMRDMAEFKQKQAEIANRAIIGEIDYRAASDEIRKLQNPMDNFKAQYQKMMDGNQDEPSIDDLVNKYSSGE